jgi:hypothetical protein
LASRDAELATSRARTLEVTASVAEIQRRLGMLALSPPNASSLASPLSFRDRGAASPVSSVVQVTTTNHPQASSASHGHSSYAFGGSGGARNGGRHGASYSSTPTTVHTVITTGGGGGREPIDDGAGSDNGSDVVDAREQWDRRHGGSSPRDDHPSSSQHLFARARAGLSPTTPRP